MHSSWYNVYHVCYLLACDKESQAEADGNVVSFINQIVNEIKSLTWWRCKIKSWKSLQRIDVLSKEVELFHWKRENRDGSENHQSQLNLSSWDLEYLWQIFMEIHSLAATIFHSLSQMSTCWWREMKRHRSISVSGIYPLGDMLVQYFMTTHPIVEIFHAEVVKKKKVRQLDNHLSALLEWSYIMCVFYY